MPYPLQLFDVEVTETASTTSVPLTVGTNFQAGDLRIAWCHAVSCGNPSPMFTSYPGWNKNEALVIAGVYVGVFTVVLTNTSADSVLTLNASNIGGAFSVVAYAAVTVRNWAGPLSPSSTFNSSGGSAYTTTAIAPSVSVTAGGNLLNFYSYRAQDITPPPGMTQLAHVLGTTGSAILAGQAYSTSGASGTKTVAATSGPADGGTATALFVPQAADITVAVGTANETDTGNAVTGSLLNKTTKVVDTAFETDSGFQVFSPLTGFRISDPQSMPGTPITASRITWQATTYAPGSTVTVETSVDNGTTWQTPINGGAVPNLLRGDTSTRTILTRTTLTRVNGGDPTPRAQFLRVEVSTDSAADEMVPLGMFVINEARVTASGGTGGGGGGSAGGGSGGVTGSGGGSSGGGTWLEVSGVDLSRVISRNSWDDVYFVTAGTNYAIAIQEMISNRLPGTSFNFASTEHVTPRLLFGTKQGNDPWQDAQDLATAIGYELFFDAAGVCTLQPIPDPAVANSVWEFTDDANPTIATLTRTLSDVTTFNKVIVQGEATANTAPVTASAIDNDPASPTYYKGPYGTVPVYFTSPMITTSAQAQAAADAILLAVKGASETVELSMVPMPALEPGDVVTVTVGDAKITGTFLVNQTTIPLSPAAAMTATCYRQA